MGTLVSIIVPVFNAERYLDDCLRGIVSQTYKELEIIVVDDGSTDSSPAICKRWLESDERIVIMRQKNAGVSAARNLGFASAHGEWTWFIDSDDVISHDAVEVLLSDTQKYNPDFVMMNIKPFDETGELPRSVVASQPFPIMGLAKGNAFITQFANSNIESYIWSCFFKTSFLKNFKGRGNPFIEEFYLLEDMAFIAQVAISQPCVFFEQKKLYGYRQVKDSLIHSYNLQSAGSGYCSLRFIETLEVPSVFRKAMDKKVLQDLLAMDGLAGISKESLNLHRVIRKDVLRLWQLTGIRANTPGINAKCFLVAIGVHALAKTALNTLKRIAERSS